MFANYVILAFIDDLEQVFPAQGMLEVHVIYQLIDSYIEYTAQSRARAAAASRHMCRCRCAGDQVFMLTKNTHVFRSRNSPRSLCNTHSVTHFMYRPPNRRFSPPLSTVLVSYIWFMLLCPRHMITSCGPRPTSVSPTSGTEL